MKTLGLRGRVILGFAAGALLLSVVLTTVTDVVGARYLIDQRERIASRQAVINGVFVEGRLVRDGDDLPIALEAVRLGAGDNAVLTSPSGSASTAIGLGPNDLPNDVVSMTESGVASLQRYRADGTPVIAVGVPLAEGYAYYEVSELENLDTTLRTIIWVGIAAAIMTTLLGAALGWWAASRVLRPLNDVARAATRLASGDLEARAPTTTDPDLTAISSSFNAMAETLAGRIQRDAQFAADVSHELRSPLTTMSASASVLESRRDELSPVVKEAVDLLVVDVKRFAALLEDLLDLARDHEPVDPETHPLVDLAELAAIALDARSGLLARRGDTRVHADRRRMSRVIANLVQNADVHGGGVTQVIVEQVGDSVRISVTDAGPGVPPQDREAVFERFSRGTSTPSRAATIGTGLGLALVRDHVRAHGGACWYEDAPGGGARFVVEIPQMAGERS
ncbi:MAG TPA: HAMP domain-containing sensor histidine kinase [Actinomycetes bacterium]|nr:HAMP domain-containing sensor histidine kinase [Actinomycetes bacterium]